jgi:hypothetical protein
MVRQAHGPIAIIVHTKQRHIKIGKKPLDLFLPQRRCEEHSPLDRKPFFAGAANLNQRNPFPQHATHLMGEKFVRCCTPERRVIQQRVHGFSRTLVIMVIAHRRGASLKSPASACRAEGNGDVHANQQNCGLDHSGQAG